MIVSTTNTTSVGNRIGLQVSNLSYTFLHWNDHRQATSKFKLLGYSQKLEEQYTPLAPTLFVEW